MWEGPQCPDYVHGLICRARGAEASPTLIFVLQSLHEIRKIPLQ